MFGGAAVTRAQQALRPEQAADVVGPGTGEGHEGS
jgi:hypothetical protein